MILAGNEFLQYWLSTIVLLLSVVTISFYLAHRKLARQYHTLEEVVEHLNHDFAGLCSAAVNVDKRLYNSDDRVKNLLKRIENFEQSDDKPQPYQSAIDKVKIGVTPQKLAEECGFSEGEAELLVRLYG